MYVSFWRCLYLCDFFKAKIVYTANSTVVFYPNNQFATIGICESD